ncbi:hypothetical protein MBAV_005957 [Candidatus Magnetobacterium bavaricum]|uniref:Uncharacterized protein n=1 Tax=Candidatus Magnetobacterium bavaricum TaxID=29290 RepID=A0A0F3GIZ4_9BACT|nr:hypothetical protein MBAV_005957 [Candidatus Magnetobacterium bavaricum]
MLFTVLYTILTEKIQHYFTVFQTTTASLSLTSIYAFKLNKERGRDIAGRPLLFRPLLL